MICHCHENRVVMKYVRRIVVINVQLVKTELWLSRFAGWNLYYLPATSSMQHYCKTTRQSSSFLYTRLQTEVSIRRHHHWPNGIDRSERGRECGWYYRYANVWLVYCKSQMQLFVNLHFFKDATEINFNITKLIYQTTTHQSVQEEATRNVHQFICGTISL